jgi:hypothetical protein
MWRQRFMQGLADVVLVHGSRGDEEHNALGLRDGNRFVGGWDCAMNRLGNVIQIDSVSTDLDLAVLAAAVEQATAFIEVA